MIALILSLSFFNNYIKQVNEEHGQNIPTYKVQIILIIFSAIRFINFIIGVSAVPQLAFGAAVYYIGKLVVWIVLFTMIGIALGTIFKAFRFDAAKVPIKEGQKEGS